MKFSARVSYGLRAAIVLADHYGKGPVLGKEISEAEGLPAAYLEQIMASLRRADLVDGTRGAKGGYVLTKAPEKITVTDLVVALEGPIQLSDCPGGTSCCNDSAACSIREIFSAAEEALVTTFNGHRLSDLLERRQVLREKAGMFYI